MRILQLQSFTREIIEFTSDVEVLEPYVQAVQSKYSHYLNGVRKKKATLNRRKYDKDRYFYAAAFFDIYRYEKRFPYHTEEEKIALHALAAKVDKYERNIIKLPLDEKTAVINNLLKEIRSVDLAPLHRTGITRWLPALEEANVAFKKMTYDTHNKQAYAKYIESASKLMKELMEAINELFQFLFAKCITSPTDELLNIQAKIGVTVEAYS